MQTTTLKLTNNSTYLLYLRQMLTIAANFCVYDGLSDYIDESYLKKCLVNKGSIAFFYDDMLDDVIALPYLNVSKLDVYNRPTRIQCYGYNGYTSGILEKWQFVIMYDNEGRYPLLYDIMQYATRLANMRRTCDINISQQRTPRIFRTKKEQEFTMKNIMRQIDNNEEMMITYNNIEELEDFNCILTPAPFVADKINIEMVNLWNDFLTMCGIVNINNEKKERMLQSELEFAQTSNIACVNNRMQPRQKAFREIYKKWGKNISCSYAGEAIINELLYNDVSNDTRQSSATDENI